MHDQMMAVADLLCGGGALSRAVRVEPAAIPTDDLDVVLGAEPRGEAPGGAIRQQIDHPSLLEIHQ